MTRILGGLVLLAGMQPEEGFFSRNYNFLFAGEAYLGPKAQGVMVLKSYAQGEWFQPHTNTSGHRMNVIATCI